MGGEKGRSGKSLGGNEFTICAHCSDLVPLSDHLRCPTCGTGADIVLDTYFSCIACKTLGIQYGELQCPECGAEYGEEYWDNINMITEIVTGEELMVCCDLSRAQCACHVPLSFDEAEEICEELDWPDVYVSEQCLEACALMGTDQCPGYRDFLYVYSIAVAGDHVTKVSICDKFTPRPTGVTHAS